MARAVDAPNLDDLSKFIVSVKAGDFIFREGDLGSEMFVIQEGVVEILKPSAREPGPVATVEVGDFFGEMALLEELPRGSSARAATDCRLLRIDQSTFTQIVYDDPEIAIRMLRKLSGRLRNWQLADQRAAQIALGPLRDTAIPSKQEEPPPAPAAPAGVLIEQESGTEFPLAAGPETTIGRPDRSTGFTPDVDLSDVDLKRTLSRRHAKIVRRDREYYLREEIGTRNGTFLNGARIPTGTDAKLTDGDQVRFGVVDMVLRLG